MVWLDGYRSFAKLKKRKNHNVAVVEAARKLVTIAWHMLNNKEHYRYAVPQSTAGKLASYAAFIIA